MRAPPPEGHASRWQVLCPWLILATGLIVYLNSFTCPFIFDDRSAVLENPNVRSLWPIWRAMSAEPQSVVAGRPIVSLTFALNYAVSRLDVRGYHAVNLALHLLAALALYGIVRQTLRSGRWAADTQDAAPWLALTVALLWVTHPLLTESVTYLTQRTELLMGLWYLVTLYCAARGLNAPTPRGWHAAAVLACGLGMGSKEVMVSAPLIVVLYDDVFVSASLREMWHRRRGLYLGLAMTWVLLAALVVPGPRSESAGFGFAHLRPWHYALTQAGVILQYLRLAIWPQPLVLDYFDWPIATSLAAVWLSVVAILILASATVWALLRRSWLGFVGAWFFLILAPTSSFLPIITELAAERRMYLSLAAVVSLAVIGGWSVLRRVPLPRSVRHVVGVVTVMAVVVTFGARTIRRNADYASEVSIWRDTVAKRPNNARAHNNLGKALWHQRRFDEAAAHFERAIELRPIYADAHSNLGNALRRQGDVEQAIRHYRKALALQPNSAAAYNNLGNALTDQGQLDEALQHYREAARLRPLLAQPHHNLGAVRYRQGRFDEAARHFQEALRVQPDFALAHHGLGMVLLRQGRVDEAIAHFAEALRLQPGDSAARAALAAAQKRQAGAAGAPAAELTGEIPADAIEP